MSSNGCVVSSKGCVVSSNGWVVSSNGCVPSSLSFILVPGDIGPRGERGNRSRNLSASFESSSRASIIFFSVTSVVADGSGRSRGAGCSLLTLKRDEPRGSTDPRLDVDGVEGPGPLSRIPPQVTSSPGERASGSLEAPAFRAARLSTRSSNSDSGGESARI